MAIFHFCFKYTDLFIAFVGVFGVFLGFILNVMWDNKQYRRNQREDQIKANAAALKEMSKTRIDLEKSIDSLSLRVSKAEKVDFSSLKLSEIQKFMKDSIKTYELLREKWIAERDLMSPGLNMIFREISKGMAGIKIISASRSQVTPGNILRLTEDTELVKGKLMEINARIL